MRVIRAVVTVLAAAAGALLASAATPDSATFRSSGTPPPLEAPARAASGPALSFMASVQLPGRRIRHYCGGALIAPRWVLTAAHCLYHHDDPVPARELGLRIGSADMTSGGVYVRAVSWFLPGDYTLSAGHDIALVKLAKPVELEPIPIPATSAPTGTRVVVPGWGQACPKRDCGGPRRYLKQPMTRILDPAGCRSGLDPATEQCVAVSSSETVCYGDSGGPALTTTAGGWWQLAGVTSRFDRGSTCGQSNAIYTDATAYTGWISDIIARNTR